MHFVTGGNFNGKRAWVNQEYSNATWISAYENKSMPKNMKDVKTDSLVLEGMEYWIRLLIEEMDFLQVREFVSDTIKVWLDWEKVDSKRQVIVIGTDITKGVVPIEKEKREWRDMTGWVYQDIVNEAKRVDIIWYGIQQTIKNEVR